MKKKEEVVEKKETIFDKARERRERFSLFVAFLGALFFVVSLLLKAKKNIDSPLFPIILILTIAYILVFVIFLFIHRNDSKKVKEDTKKFKSVVSFFNLIMNLIFVVVSVLIFIQSLSGLKEDPNIFVLIDTGFSGLLLLLKLISILKKVNKTVKKQANNKKKEK